MEIDKLATYEDVKKYLKEKEREIHLLLGNGFSMAYDPDIFSYNALSNFIDKTDDAFLKKLFSIINTKNFELVMQELDNFYELAVAFSNDQKLIDRIKTSSETLKRSLIEAVEQLHPEHVFTIPEEKSLKCFEFLNYYLSNNGNIFSTNYDLLLYWITMRNKTEKAIDGFGRDVIKPADESPTGEAELSELRWGNHKEEQSIFYLHGALQLFDTGTEVIKEQYDSVHYLIEKIRERMHRKEYPIFVTAGNEREKLIHIAHNKYLSYCYDKFTNITGSLISFGFNFGDSDKHIIDGINKATYFDTKQKSKLFSIYIGVYSDEGFNRIKEKEKLFKCKVNYFNARTCGIWD